MLMKWCLPNRPGRDRFNERFGRMLIAQIGGFTALVVAILLN